MNQIKTRRNQITLITYLLGIFLLILLSKRLGDNGVAYLAVAAESCMILSIFTITFLPETMEKLMHARMSKGQFKNADRVFKTAVIYALITGIFCTLLGYIFSGLWMEKVLCMPYGRLALWCLLPVYFLNACSCSLKGYFQGTGTSMPSVVAQVIKYIFMLTFAPIFAYIFGEYGDKVSNLLQRKEFVGMYVAGGAGLGAVLASVLSLLFLVFVYLGAGRRQKQKNKEGLRLSESYPQAFRSLWMTTLPSVGMLTLLKLPDLLGLFFYQRVQEDRVQSTFSYGIFYGKYEIWMLVAAILLGIGILSIIGKVISGIRREEYKHSRDQLQVGFSWAFMWSAFLTAFLMSVGPLLMKGIYGVQERFLTRMFLFGSPTLIFMIIGGLFLGILWEDGNVKKVLNFLLSSLCVYLVFIIAGLKINGGKIEILAYGQLIFFAVICLTGGVFLFRKLHFRPDWVRGILLPGVSALVTGLIMWMLGKVLEGFMPDFIVALLCLLIGAFCHLILLFILRCAREKEYLAMPAGKILVKIGKILHLL